MEHLCWVNGTFTLVDAKSTKISSDVAIILINKHFSFHFINVSGNYQRTPNLGISERISRILSMGRNFVGSSSSHLFNTWSSLDSLGTWSNPKIVRCFQSVCLGISLQKNGVIYSNVSDSPVMTRDNPEYDNWKEQIVTYLGMNYSQIHGAYVLRYVACEVMNFLIVVSLFFRIKR